MDARLTLLPSAPKVKHRARVHLHAGTAETMAEVFLYAENELSPGQNGLAHLRLQDDVLLLPGDRFIVRRFSPVITIGGGVVLDALARRPVLRDTGRIEFLQTLEGGSPEKILAAMVERAPLGARYDEIVARTGWPEKEIQKTAEKVAGVGSVKVIHAEPLLLVASKYFDEICKKIVETVNLFPQ